LQVEACSQSDESSNQKGPQNACPLRNPRDIRGSRSIPDVGRQPRTFGRVFVRRGHRPSCRHGRPAVPVYHDGSLPTLQRQGRESLDCQGNFRRESVTSLPCGIRCYRNRAGIEQAARPGRPANRQVDAACLSGITEGRGRYRQEAGATARVGNHNQTLYRNFGFAASVLASRPAAQT